MTLNSTYNFDDKFFAWVVGLRRHLHQNPELSLKEHATSSFCQQVLTELGYKITPLWETGFVADLALNHPTTIALRADMDALPIIEQNTHAFVSQNNGVAHMCGHDVHMAIALAAARMLSERQAELKANVRLIFQPSEEELPGGASGMIANGCLEGVSEIYGLHNDPELKVGTARCLEGAMTAACDQFIIEITGKGGHVASPHTALDPVYIATCLVTEFNAILARHINPMHKAVISVTSIQAGNMDALNIIPQTAKLAGVVRTFAVEDRNYIFDYINAASKSKEALGYQVAVKQNKSYPSVINQTYGQARVVAALRAVLGEEYNYASGDPKGWGEDYAYYLQHAPGAFFILGSGDTEKCAPLHSAKFDVNEQILLNGAAIFFQLAMSAGNS